MRPKCVPVTFHLCRLSQIPAHKVKLVVGAGGEKIKFIQKKTKCRIQVRFYRKQGEHDEAELSWPWAGARGPKVQWW